ncbi:MAG: hypothetical protein HYS18_10825 [Burkholderiales bacterium]|nr:hypothetical protein [Burkholderiales bacterium]
MKKTFLVLPCIAIVILAACTSTPPATSSASPASAPLTTAAPSFVPVMVSNDYMTDPAGMTLYTYDKDPAGKSVCNGQCAANWPPLLAFSNSVGSKGFTVITRDDGKMQWAYKGKPLYNWKQDKNRGDKTGEGMDNNAWHVARP